MGTLPFIGDNEKIALSAGLDVVRHYEGIGKTADHRQWFVDAATVDLAVRYVELRHAGRTHDQALAVLNDVLLSWYSAQGLAAGPFPPLAVPPPPMRPPTAPAQVWGSRAVAHADVPTLHVGVSRFYWLWAWKHDRDRVLRELDQDVDAGYTFARVFFQLGNPTDPNDYWAERIVDPFGWSDYDAQVRGLLGACMERGLYVSAALIGKGGRLDWQDERRAYIARMGALLRDHTDTILLAQVMNEPGILGRVTVDELNELEGILRASSGGQLLTSTGAYDAIEGIGVERGDMGQVGTPHFDRDTTRSEGQDRPWRQPWDWGMLGGLMMDDEHIGPGSSVAEEWRPFVLRSHRTVCFLSGFFGSVYHADPGIRGYGDLAATPGYRECPAAVRFLPGDLPNGEAFRAIDTNEPADKFRGRHWIQPAEYTRAGNNNTRGIVRTFGRHVGGVGYYLPFGPVSAFTLVAEYDLRVRCYQQDVNDLLWERQVGAGEPVTFTAAHPDYLLVSERL